MCRCWSICWPTFYFRKGRSQFVVLQSREWTCRIALHSSFTLFCVMTSAPQVQAYYSDDHKQNADQFERITCLLEEQNTSSCHNDSSHCCPNSVGNTNVQFCQTRAECTHAVYQRVWWVGRRERKKDEIM